MFRPSFITSRWLSAAAGSGRCGPFTAPNFLWLLFTSHKTNQKKESPWPKLRANKLLDGNSWKRCGLKSREFLFPPMIFSTELLRRLTTPSCSIGCWPPLLFHMAVLTTWAWHCFMAAWRCTPGSDNERPNQDLLVNTVADWFVLPSTGRLLNEYKLVFRVPKESKLLDNFRHLLQTKKYVCFEDFAPSRSFMYSPAS